MPSCDRPRTLLDLVHSDLSLRCLSRKERLVLGAICLCTLALLAALQHGRVFLGDEIGTLRYLKESAGYILTHFRHPSIDELFHLGRERRSHGFAEQRIGD